MASTFWLGLLEVCAHVYLRKGEGLGVELLYFFLTSTAAPYNAEKEAKEEKEAKDKKLAKIEEARKKAAEDKGLSMFSPGLSIDRSCEPSIIRT